MFFLCTCLVFNNEDRRTPLQLRYTEGRPEARTKAAILKNKGSTRSRGIVGNKKKGIQSGSYRPNQKRERKKSKIEIEMKKKERNGIKKKENIAKKTIRYFIKPSSLY